MRTTIMVLGCALLFNADLWAQKPTDLIKTFDPKSDTVAGEWTSSESGLKVGPDRNSRAILSTKTPQSYSLTLEFTRPRGDGSIGVVLPVGPRQCVLNMSAFNGEAHGIGLVDGKPARDNSTSVQPGKLSNNHAYRLIIEVDVNDEEASVVSQLDGRAFLKWAGDPKSLSMMDFWTLRKNSDLGLFTNSEVTFHAITLTPLNPKMRMTPKPKTPESPTETQESVRFENRDWDVASSTEVAVEQFKGKTALHVKGGEESFVFLPNVKFGDGTIEVDVASSTFSGIGFRGQAGGKLAQKVYFRPFNSGTAKHENTVQYSLMGMPKFGWKSLREQFPSKYEAGADIKNDEWFHVRLEIKGERVEVFVNENKQPVLIVEEMLGTSDGKLIGVWGWDSYFVNFTFRPSE